MRDSFLYQGLTKATAMLLLVGLFMVIRHVIAPWVEKVLKKGKGVVEESQHPSDKD